MMNMRKQFSFTVLFEPTEEGGYTAIVPALPGVVTEGRTLDEARAMARMLCRGRPMERVVMRGRCVLSRAPAQPRRRSPFGS